MAKRKKFRYGRRISTAMRKMVGICPVCGRPFTYPRKRRLDTAYIEDQRNYLFSCKGCYDRMEAAYESQWDEYYNTRF